MVKAKNWHEELHFFLESLDVPFLRHSQPHYELWEFPSHQTRLLSYSLAFASSVTLEQDTSPNAQRTIHLWEDIWHTKKEIVQSRLKAILGQTVTIPARLTQARRINAPTINHFLEVNHLQGTTTAKYKWGLFLPKRYFRVLPHAPVDESEELLVAVASFSGGKNISRNGQVYRSYELIRFANLVHHTVVGGMGKLIKAFEKDILPDDLMTYADRDWSEGWNYESLGFERIEATPPQAFWVNPDTFERFYESRLSSGKIPAHWVKVYNRGNWKFLKKWK